MFLIIHPNLKAIVLGVGFLPVFSLSLKIRGIMSKARKKTINLLKNNKFVSYGVAISLLILIVFNAIHLYKDCSFKNIVSIINTIASSILISFLGYIFFVCIPERNKINKNKNYLKRQYLYFKGNMIQTFLHAGNFHVNHNQVKKLLNIQEFANFFSNNNWYEVLNGLKNNELQLKEVLYSLESLEKDLQFVLHDIEIKNEELFRLMKDLSENILHYRRRMCLDTDDFKFLMRFLHSLFSGYCPISGCANKDIVLDAINSI